MRQLIALRNAPPVLGRGDIEFLDPENPHVLAFVRTMEGEPPMLCVANLSRLAQHVELDLRSTRASCPSRCSAGTGSPRSASSLLPVTLAPYGFFWFSLGATSDAPTATTPTSRADDRGPAPPGAARARARGVDAGSPLVRGEGTAIVRALHVDDASRCSTTTWRC